MNTEFRNNIPKRFKLIAWLNIITQVSFPLSCVFTPTIANSTTIFNQKLLSENQLDFHQTQAYRLQEGETILSITKKYNITIDSLRKLNQFRTFSQPFEQLQSGAELDIPMAPLPTIIWDSTKPKEIIPTNDEIKLAQLASQTGKFLTNKPSQENTETLVRNMVTSTVSTSIQNWMNQRGNAQIRLEADKQLSFKNSQFDILLPLYETEQKLLFTQGSLHRTDDRLQTNLGFGIRWFGDQQMFGANTFFDHDISRGHSRFGLGAEYHRDFLKLAANSYHPISQWKASKDLDDHAERPSHGWDIRAEGWLPNYPHLGGKLTYEQYYGDRVALFGAKNLQRNPHAITASVNYTPFPLLTFTAEQRQGKSSQQDTRLGMNITYHLGKTWKEHINPEAVSKLRSLVGGRYDFVDRNNNIILQYLKKEVIHLLFSSVITGYAGEKKPLEYTVNSQYGFDHINWSAPVMIAAGGQFIDEKNGRYSVILPEYKSDTKAVNLYTVNATAIDKKNNSSPNVTLQVIVTQPAIYSTKSGITPQKVSLTANGKTEQTLTLLVKDKNGHPIDIAADEIRLEKTSMMKRAKRSAPHGEARGLKASRKKTVKISPFSRLAAGQYQATLTAGITPEIFSLTPVVRETLFSPIQVTIVADKTTPQISSPIVNTTQPQVANGKNPVEIKIQLTDTHGNPLANTEVTWGSNKDSKEVIFKDTVTTTDKDGFATATINSTVSGEVQITATADSATPQDIQVTFVPDKTTSTIATNNIHIAQKETVANGKTPNVVEIKVTDAHGNPVPNTEVKFATDKGQLTETTVKTDSHGVAKTEITSAVAGDAIITITVDGKETQQTLLFESDKTTPQISSPTVNTTQPQVANGKNPVEIKIQLTDTHGNPLANTEVTWGSNKDSKEVVFKDSVTTTDNDGFATATINSTVSGEVQITATADSATPQDIQVTFVPDKTTSTIATNNIHIAQKETVANGKTPNVVEIKVTDAHGNPVPNTEVKFATDKGQLTETTVKTDSHGVAKTEITSTVAGDAIITITVDGKETQQTLQFESDKTTPQISSPIVNTTQPQVANGKNPVEIKIQLTDTHGNPLANTEVTWGSNKDSKEVIFKDTVTTTDKDGFATAIINSTVSGEVQITATADSATPQDIQVTFVPDKTTSTIATNNIHIAQKETVANGKTPNVVEIKVTDAHGNPVPNTEVKFATDKGQLTETVVKTDSHGVAKTEITSTVAGDAIITITVDGKETQQTLQFESDKTTPQISSPTVNTTQPQVANGKNPVEIKIQLTDTHGNPLANTDITWDSNKAPKEVVFKDTVTTTDKDGFATAIINSTVSGEVQITATASGATPQDIQVTFVPDKTTSTIATNNIHIAQKETVANGKTPNVVEIKVTDAHGNPVPNTEVKFATDKGQLTETTVKTDRHGVAKTEITSTVAGDAIITITVDGKETQQTLQFESDKTTPQLVKPNTSNPPQVANGAAPFEIKTQLTDANGNPLANTVVKWLSDKSSSEVTFSNTTTMTDKDGYATTQVTSTTAGNVVITATANNTSPQKISVEFLPDNSTATIKPSDLVISHTSSVADGSTPNTVSVTVTDAKGNKIPNIEVGFKTDKGNLTNTKVMTDANGIAKTELKSTEIGNALVTISVGGNSFDKTISFIANHQTAKVNSVIPEPKKLYLADGKTRVIYTAKVIDANNNPIANMDVNWSSNLPTSELEITPKISKTDAQGVTTIAVTSTKAAPVIVTASVNNNSKSASSISFTADNTKAQISAFNISKQTIIANGTDTTLIDTYITDNYGNPLEGVEVKFTNNRGKDVNIATLSPLFKTNKNGYVKVEVSTRKAMEIILSAQIASNSSAKSTTIRSIADNSTATATITASKDSVQISQRTQKVTLKAVVKDAEQNPLVNTPITWLSDNNQLNTNTTLTDSQGQAQVELSGYTAGKTTVTAQLLNSNEEQKVIQFLASEAKAQYSSFEIKPQTITANGQMQATAIFTLKDQWDNPITGKSVQWESDNKAITISDKQELATNKGVYQAKISGTQAGSYTIKAISGTIIKQKMIGFVADQSTSTLTDINITGLSSVKADGVSHITVQAIIKDAAGNPASGIPVGWKTEIGELNQVISNTDYRGIAQVTLTSSIAGKGKVSAILGQSTKKIANEITFLPDSPSKSASTVVLTVPSISAATGKTEVIVTIKDNTGNRLWGLHKKISLGYSTDLGLEKTPVFTENKTRVGTYHAELSGIKAGKTNVSVYVDGVKLDNDVALTVTANSRTAKVRGDITSVKTTEVVGNEVTYNATFEDANGNLLGAGVPVFWIANDGTLLSASQTITDANGQSRITVKRNLVGSAEVTVNLTSQNSKAARVVHFTQATLDISKTTFGLVTDTIVAGKQTHLNIVLKDQFGNLLTRPIASIKVKSSTSHISIKPVTEVALGHYQAVVTSNQAVTGILNVEVDGVALTQPKNLNIIGDKADLNIKDLVASTKTVKVGSSTGVIYQVTVVDKYGNPLPAVNVSWHLQGKAEPFPYSSTTNLQGVAEIKLTSLKAGELVMTAVLSDKVEKKASVVQVIAGDINTQLSTFTANKTEIGPDNKEEIFFTVKLQDDFGNAISNQKVMIESNLPKSDFIIQSVVDHQDGRYSAKATAATTAAKKGSVKLTAKVNNKTIAKSIDIKIDAITPILSFDKSVKSTTYSSAIDNGQTIKGLPNGFMPRWSSDNTSIATVDDQGKVKLKKAGRTKIWARIDGDGVYKSAAVSYDLDVEKAKPKLKLTSSKTIKATWDDGAKPKIEAAFDNTDAATLPVEYISKHSNIAQIDFQTGVIAQIKPGVAKLTINTKETEQFLADSQEITYDLAKAHFNIKFTHSEQETTDQKNQFNLQQASPAVPQKAGAVWVSDSKAIVDISSNGSINRLSKGKTKLTLAIKNNDYYEDTQASYTTKVYAKPNLSSTNIVYRNNGQEKRSGTEWLPVYTDDTLTVNIPPIQYTEYDKPLSVEVLLKSGNRILKTEKLQNIGKHNSVTFQPDKDYYKKDLVIEVNAPGKTNLGIVASKQHNVLVDYIDPLRIGKLQTDYQPRYIVTDDDKDDADNKCLDAASAWLYSSHRHFLIQPITKLDIGTKSLLVPLRISHSVQKVNGDVDTFDFKNHYEVKNTDRYKFDSVSRKYSVKSACLSDYYGNGILKTHLEFGDKSENYEMKFYWEGLNRHPHKPSI
ncbi:Ig-like domain-containing protein [Providencia heimbachae]|uniref:Invasin n=1 Tax=Providencia heimbachae ATCC 35613 TaxID=1354272 RepID=A0A1B7JTW8_9GAMM|nr:Ig-like domain-containing protein [Providencia heimbachae]OAT51358.1 hypothetical protein M998_2295 [Providencia heimbachae ATCC 35613]SQH11522.1 Invasin [Providencia heimbachae]